MWIIRRVSLKNKVYKKALAEGKTEAEAWKNFEILERWADYPESATFEAVKI